MIQSLLLLMTMYYYASIQCLEVIGIDNLQRGRARRGGGKKVPVRAKLDKPRQQLVLAPYSLSPAFLHQNPPVHSVRYDDGSAGSDVPWRHQCGETCGQSSTSSSLP